MVAFVILFMFFVGLGLGAWAMAYYFQVVSPDRVRSFLSQLESLRLAGDIAHAGDAARAAMNDVANFEDSDHGPPPPGAPARDER